MEATGAEAFCDPADHWMHPHPVADAGTGEVGTQGEQGPLVSQDILLCPCPSSAAPRDMPSLFWFSDDIYHSKGTSVAGRPPLIYYKAISVPISKCIGTKKCDVHHTIKVHLKVIWNYDYGHGEVQRLTRAEISEKRSPVPFSLWKSHTFNYFYRYWGNLSFTCGSSDLNELDSVTRYNA